MYRIVKELNRLNGRTQYVIEQRKRFFFWTYSTKELDIDLHGLKYVGASTIERARYNLEVIKSGRIIVKGNVYTSKSK